LRIKSAYFLFSFFICLFVKCHRHRLNKWFSFFEFALLNRSKQFIYQKVFDSCRWDSFSKIL
jgi:hypothetical protein